MTAMQLQYSKLQDHLEQSGVRFRRKYPLKFHTYFKSGGRAEFVVYPGDSEQFGSALACLKGLGLEYKVVGSTSNIMFLDELDYGVIICTQDMSEVRIEGEDIVVGAGYVLGDLARIALMQGRTGLEGLEGVPGTVGGAIVMNAGAYGYEISDQLVSVLCVDANGVVFDLSRAECDFRYRHSLFRERADIIVLGARFRMKNAERRLIASRMETFHIARHAYQEFAYPTLGSAFSVRGDFYKTMFAGSRRYAVACFVIKLIFKNPLVKLISRKRPTNEPLNKLARRYLGIGEGGYPVSHKSMNILINSGDTTSLAKMAYLSAIRAGLPDDVRIENEVVLSPLSLPLEDPAVQSVIAAANEHGFQGSSFQHRQAPSLDALAGRRWTSPSENAAAVVLD